MVYGPLAYLKILKTGNRSILINWIFTAYWILFQLNGYYLLPRAPYSLDLGFTLYYSFEWHLGEQSHFFAVFHYKNQVQDF
jgi:hypothetical protein